MSVFVCVAAWKGVSGDIPDRAEEEKTEMAVRE